MQNYLGYIHENMTLNRDVYIHIYTYTHTKTLYIYIYGTPPPSYLPVLGEVRKCLGFRAEVGQSALLYCRFPSV